MKQITKRKTVRSTEYFREFEWPDKPGSGFSFPCDKNGVVDGAYNSYDKILSGVYVVLDRGVRTFERTIVEPALWKCECGRTASIDYTCGVPVCYHCGRHNGLARCFCGWSLSKGNGRRELIEMGEDLGDN